MASPIKIAILANGRQARSEMNQTAETGETMGSRLGRGVKAAGAAVALGAAVAVGAAVKLGVSAVKSASAAQQSMGASETVFGRFANKVVGHSRRAAQSVGLSANEYRESANLIGSLFKNQGVAADQLAGKTDKMIRTGADLAATYGGTTREAVEALGSAFKGEFDPLERYGISIKQSTINAELAARGQDKLTGAELRAAQQRATTALITRQAGGALGAFGREANTLEGQQQRLGASWENLKAKGGAVLLPVLTKLAGFANDKLVPALERIGPPVMAFAREAGARLAPVFSRVGQLFNAAAPVVSRLAAGFARMVPPVARVAGQIAERLAPVARQMADTFQTRVLPTIQRNAPAIQRLAGTVARLAGRFLVTAATITGRVLPPLIRFAGFIFSRVVPALVRNASTLFRVIAALARFGAAVGRGVAAVVKFGFTVGRKIGEVVRFFTGLPGRIARGVGNLGGLLVRAGSSVVQGLIDGISSRIGAVRDKLSQLTNLIPSWKGPAARDKRLLTPAGRLIIRGLVNGLDREKPEVRRTLQALSREITNFSAEPTIRPTVSAAQAYASTTSGGTSGGRTLRFEFSTEQVSAMQRGKRIKADVREYEMAGGK